MRATVLSPFVSKDGRFIVPRAHIATFKGKHNASKTKVLIILYHRKHVLRLNSGLTLREINLQCGVSLAYLEGALLKWYEWRYVTRTLSKNDSTRPSYRYNIAIRGERFIEIRVPKKVLIQYISEIRAFQSSTLARATKCSTCDGLIIVDDGERKCINCGRPA